MTNLWLCEVLSMLNCRKAVTCRVIPCATHTINFGQAKTVGIEGCDVDDFNNLNVPMLSLQSAQHGNHVHQTHATIFCIPISALSHLNDMALKPSSRRQGLWRGHFGHDLKMSPTQWQLFGLDGFWAWHRLTFTFTMWLTWLSIAGQIWVPNR